MRWVFPLTLAFQPLLVASAAGQSADLPASLDLEGLGKAPHSRMQMKLEKTIFKVDVLNVYVWLGEENAGRLGELVEGKSYSDHLTDSVAAVALSSRNAYVRIEFLRDISLKQFLDGIDGNMRRLPKEDVLERSEYERISAGLPVWFDFLRERGIWEGDEVFYRIRGDTLRTIYRSVEGPIMLDQTDIGPASRLSVLGSYFVRGTDFRNGLVKSLFESH